MVAGYGVRPARMNPRIAQQADLTQHVARSVERVGQLGGAVDVCPAFAARRRLARPLVENANHTIAETSPTLPFQVSGLETRLLRDVGTRAECPSTDLGFYRELRGTESVDTFTLCPATCTEVQASEGEIELRLDCGL